MAVLWNWDSGAPEGKIADTKDHGDVAIESKRGDITKKNAAPDNLAVHIELNDEEKVSDSASSKKCEHKKEEGDRTITENAEG
jgi:hypothetical protein